MIRVGAAHHQGRSADRRRAGHGHPGLSRTTATRRRSSSSTPHLHNVPLQIAAERGLPALALWLWFIVVLLRDSCEAPDLGACLSLPTAGARRRRRDAGRRDVRIQFRRLRVPDAVPGAGDASLRRRSRAGGDAAAGMPRSRLTISTARRAARSLAGRTVLVVGDLMLDHFVIRHVSSGFRRKRRCRSSSSSTRVPSRRRRQRRPQHRRARRARRRSSASSATTTTAATVAHGAADGSASARRASSPIRDAARRGSCAS